MVEPSPSTGYNEVLTSLGCPPVEDQMTPDLNQTEEDDFSHLLEDDVKYGNSVRDKSCDIRNFYTEPWG